MSSTANGITNETLRERPPAGGWSLLLDVKGLIALTRFSRSTLYKLFKTRDFPRGIEIKGVGRRWRRADIEKWVDGLWSAEGPDHAA
jgi:predicted DNA-binding transcriptional regulator AlpA